MMFMLLGRRLAATALAILIVGGVVTQGQAPAGRGAVQAPVAAPAPPVSSADMSNAEETRRQLSEMLEKYPPALARVLKLDPSLLNNPTYLSPYPALDAFLSAHPEVAHDPGYFFARVPGADVSYRPTDAATMGMDMWRNMFDAFSVFVIFITVTGALLWLIKTLLDWRRWTRMARVQAEVHSKLLDRFTANEELLAYIQTSAGRRFLESGPVLAEAGPRPLGAPVSRILWSFQVGIVLAVAGFGLFFATRLVQPEVAQGLSVLGVLAIALGVGFILSGLAAWLISRRMGLFEAMLTQAAAKDATPV
jgi:hypothetical protein